MSQTRVDDSRWPLVVFTAVGTQSADDLEEYFAECEVLLHRRQPYGAIYDARRSLPAGPKRRQRVVQWLSRNDALLRAYVVASGIVMSTPLQRGGLRAVLWMRPLPFPYSVETTLEGAQRFVCARLADRGCPTPPPCNWGGVRDSRVLEKSRRGVDTR
jgi:hypothetical protein